MLRRLVAAATLALSLLLLGWGIWLVATPDYDGGRRPAGTMMVVVAVAAIAAALETVS